MILILNLQNSKSKYIKNIENEKFSLCSFLESMIRMLEEQQSNISEDNIKPPSSSEKQFIEAKNLFDLAIDSLQKGLNEKNQENIIAAANLSVHSFKDYVQHATANKNKQSVGIQVNILPTGFFCLEYIRKTYYKLRDYFDFY